MVPRFSLCRPSNIHARERKRKKESSKFLPHVPHNANRKSDTPSSFPLFSLINFLLHDPLLLLRAVPPPPLMRFFRGIKNFCTSSSRVPLSADTKKAFLLLFRRNGVCHYVSGNGTVFNGLNILCALPCVPLPPSRNRREGEKEKEK